MSVLKRFGLSAMFLIAGAVVLIGLEHAGESPNEAVHTSSGGRVAATVGDATEPSLRDVDTAALRRVVGAALTSFGTTDSNTAEVVQTTMADVRASIGESDDPPDTGRVVVVQLTGDFVADSVPRPAGAAAPRGHKLDLMYRADTLAPVGTSVGDTGMDLAALGSVETLDLSG